MTTDMLPLYEFKIKLLKCTLKEFPDLIFVVNKKLK